MWGAEAGGGGGGKTDGNRGSPRRAVPACQALPRPARLFPPPSRAPAATCRPWRGTAPSPRPRPCPGLPPGLRQEGGFASPSHNPGVSATRPPIPSGRKPPAPGCEFSPKLRGLGSHRHRVAPAAIVASTVAKPGQGRNPKERQGAARTQR